MILYIHLQEVDYVDCYLAMIASARIYNMHDFSRVLSNNLPANEQLYIYHTTPNDGENVQRFIEWISTRPYCKDISVE